MTVLKITTERESPPALSRHSGAKTNIGIILPTAARQVWERLLGLELQIIQQQNFHTKRDGCQSNTNCCNSLKRVPFLWAKLPTPWKTSSTLQGRQGRDYSQYHLSQKTLQQLHCQQVLSLWNGLHPPMFFRSVSTWA